jgi:hypothetical protein
MQQGRSASASSAGRRAAERKGLPPSAAAAAADAAPPPPPATMAQAVAERKAIFQEQDAILDRMSVSMGTLQQVAGAITGELDEQATLLEDTSLAVEVAHGDMEAVTKRVNKLVEKAGGPKWCGILTCLTTILIVLTWIAFS